MFWWLISADVGLQVSDKAVTLSYLPAPDSSDSSSSSSNARHMRLGRKLLQRQQQPPASAVVEPIMTRVWVQYQRVDASNVTTLLAALADAFSTTRLQSTNKAKSQQQQQQQPVWKLNEMTNLTGTMFGAYSKKLLHSRGAQLDNNSYAVFVNGPPVVSNSRTSQPESGSLPLTCNVDYRQRLHH